jgi:hypothetical protein
MLRKPKKVMLTVLVILILASSTYAFANANTIALSAVGSQVQPVTGYLITNIVYDLTTGDPTKLSKILFDIAPATSGDPVPATVLISTTTAPNYTTSECVITGGNLVTCTFGTVALPVAINVISVTKLDIVASSSANP